MAARGDIISGAQQGLLLHARALLAACFIERIYLLA